MPIPRHQPPSALPLLSLSLPDSEDNLASQPPLCTPVDQLIHKPDNLMPSSPPSPIRTTVKRRRTSAQNVMQADNMFTNPFSVNSCSQRLRLPPQNPLPCDEQPSRPHPPSCSPRRGDLPEMSQDTLALFPKIVQEHHMRIRAEEFNYDSQQSFDVLPVRPPLAPQTEQIDSRFAQASLYNALSSARSMTNPFLQAVPPPARSPPLVTPHSGKNFAIRKVANASESFQNMVPVLDFDETRCTPTLNPHRVLFNSGSKRKAVESKEDKMNRLKVLLVSSTKGRNFRIDFELVREAGKGAFSQVLEVRHRLDGCTYAVKKNSQPLMSDKARLEYLQEVFALSALQGHPNILRYHDAWFEDQGKHLLMQTEFLHEGSLFSHYIEQKRSMPLQELFALAADISSALSFMHSKGIVHLDVKPDNIFRCNRGLVRESFLIGDFGLACHHDGTDARSTEGDSRYLCPEALETFSGQTYEDLAESSEEEVPPSDDETGNSAKAPHAKKRKHSNVFDLRPRDIFSLGATLYELATGMPLEKSGPEWIQLRNNTRKAAMEVGAKCNSTELAHILKICLEQDPQRRATASEVMEICKAHDTPENSRYVEKLRQERDAAQRQCRRFDRATSAILKNGEVNRQRYRENCVKQAELVLSRTQCR